MLNKFFSVEGGEFITIESLSSELKETMDSLKSMDSREFTLWEKWYELHIQKKPSMDYSHLIWTPSDWHDKEKTIAEIESLKPAIRIVDNSVDRDIWNAFRLNITTMKHVPIPGRGFNFFVVDSDSDKILGIGVVSSDVIAMKLRDDYIGWTPELKTGELRKLNHSAIGSAIVPVQPFGYNLLGGKLIASMIVHQDIRKEWESRYGDVLVSMTTTSLYGSYSMYNSHPLWKKLGTTSGQTLLQPPDHLYKKLLDFVKSNYPDEFKRAKSRKKLFDEGIVMSATSPKQRILEFIFRKCNLNLSDYYHNFKRGLYIAMMYENGREFLQGQFNDPSQLILKDKYKNIDSFVDSWWKKKAINRYLKLHESGQLQEFPLWYSHHKHLDWQDFRNHYLQ